jgi:serine/threonine-protein kinase RsbW
MIGTEGVVDLNAVPLTAAPVFADLQPWLRVFPGEACELSAVRRWLMSLLPDVPARDDVTSVATELGSNAIRHTASGHGGSFAVEVTWRPQVVRVAVADSGAAGEPLLVNDPMGESGRGLFLVRGLAIRAGACGDHRGRLVWADVRWEQEGGVRPGSGEELAGMYGAGERALRQLADEGVV